MAVTSNTFTGDGSTTNYSFTFEYLEQDEVKVTINGFVTTAFTFANATTLSFTTAPSSGAEIRIYRDTNIDDLKATFFPGSAIKAEDLNNNFTQNNFAVQELRNNTWDVDLQTIKSNEAWVSTDSQIATTAALDQRFQDEVNDTLTKAELAALGDVMPDDDVAIPTTGATKDYIDHVIETDILVDGTGLNKSGSGGQVIIGISANSVDLDRIKNEDIITSAEVNPNNDTTIATTAKIDDMIDAAITGDIGTDGTGITVTDDGDGTITLGLASNSIDLDRIKNADIITYSEQDAGSPAPADTNIFTASAAARRFDTIVQTSIPSGSAWEVGKTWLQNDNDKTVSIWNGSAWVAVASGGAFTTLPKVVYVDALNGDDALDGHRISNPKKTIKAALNQINADPNGDGSVVFIAPGTYQEECPLDIQKSNVSIIGQALRSCVIHPTVATEQSVMFRVNSGSYISNLTFTGMKASGAPGNTVDPELPVQQGWNVAFYPNAIIRKSPYIQNCTNFSDSEIDNSNINVINPAGGAGGDIDSQPTGGGMLVDGSAVDVTSPLRSMVCDSYTHVGLNGPGILVTNNGYAQCTSSYAFFNTYHIKCLNGGQANLAASTTDFGYRGLVADGKSTTTIFTADLSSNAADGDITFTIDAPVADPSWHGTVTRPQANMLVELNGIIYPIISSTENGAGWDVTISRPNPLDRSDNLGLNGAVTTPATANFYLRSMVASSGHTMEYVGSGTDYRALPENGGVPIEANQVVELNNGKVWTATTDHKGKFKVGDFFEIDQQLGFVTITSGSIKFDLASDPSPELSANLDANSFKITDVQDPTDSQDAATKAYVDLVVGGPVGSTSASFIETPQTLTNSKVIGANINAACMGPIAVDSGVTITIGSNSKLSVLNY